MATAAERARAEGQTVEASEDAKREHINRQREAEHGMTAGELRALQREAEAADRPRQVYGDLARDDLYALARQLDVPGRSKMDKDELAAAVADATRGRGRTPRATSTARTRRRTSASGSVSVPAAVRKPTRSVVGSFVKFLGAGVGLTMLYVALNNAEGIATVAGLPGRVLRWLSDPTASVPYVNEGE